MKTETVINDRQNAVARQPEESNQRIAGKLAIFSAAKDAHAASMHTLKDIDTSIERCKQERQAALEESTQAEQDWRSRFRSLRGNLTPEMKAEHGRRIASRELADEFTGLIAELENDRKRAMLGACTTGNKYRAAYDDALSTYAGAQWSQALAAVPATLVRAFVLRTRALEMKGEASPQSVALAELRDVLSRLGDEYQFDMTQEPVLSVTGMHRPHLAGVDTELLNSPAKRMMLAKALAENSGTKAEA
ncbi:capsid protein [Cronobacter malonaticus]|uniref:capsid protein n=1 Tax=Cronobacter malonaticus TaxID=413503 RepID=UPI002894EE5B|nr:capsid protein [Cronobacter malonaticus]MDT3566473.1 capsid protein [Cronobacter malonaticus]